MKANTATTTCIIILVPLHETWNASGTAICRIEKVRKPYYQKKGHEIVHGRISNQFDLIFQARLTVSNGVCAFYFQLGVSYFVC